MRFNAYRCLNTASAVDKAFKKKPARRFSQQCLNTASAVDKAFTNLKIIYIMRELSQYRFRSR